MATQTTRGSAGLEEREAQLDTTLAALQEQRWALSEASYERSVVRSRRGDYEGALLDAKAALAFAPGEVKYLIRAAQASYDNGLLHKVSKCFNRAQRAVDQETFNTVGTVEAMQATLVSLAALDRRLRPFEILPDELLAAVFEHIHQDWETMPSPLQLLHVCPRWRRVAMSTPALWRDTRILRIHTRASTYAPSYDPPVLKAYPYGEVVYPDAHACSRRDAQRSRLLDLCAELSLNSLTHFELEVRNWENGGELVYDLPKVAYRSRATLESIALVHTDDVHREQLSTSTGTPCEFAAMSINLVMQCPKLRDVQLSLGKLMESEEHVDEITKEALRARPVPSFRRLQLDSFGGFTNSKGARMGQSFLKRSSKLRSLTLRDVPSYDSQPIGRQPPPFALQLVRVCAHSLVELELDARAGIFAGLKAIGIVSFPLLRRFRHVPREYSFDPTPPGEIDGMLFPKLESIEAPASVIIAFPTAPPSVTLRIRSEEQAEECNDFAQWLLQITGDQSPRSLTIMATGEFDNDILWTPIIDALTPSLAGVVACPRLTELRFIRRISYESDGTGNAFPLDPAPLPTPIWREDWEWRVSASGVAQLEAERRNLAQKSAVAEPAVTAAQLSPMPSEGVGAGADLPCAGATTRLATCEALCTVELEGCFVSAKAWAKMKSSATLFTVTPNPDDMAKLRYSSEYAAQCAKRKFDSEEL